MKALLAAVALGALALSTAPAAAAAGGPQFFQSPSKNIGCAYQPASAGQPASLRCDVKGGLKPLPPKPATCDVDWGQGYSMTKTGRAHPVCAGDTALNPDAKTLANGHTWRGGGFKCLAKKSGLSCENAKHHGFIFLRKHDNTF